ncbi:SLBB domain-containing protein [uncultured Mailhella sp.]|uniref:polysaccharide biosynthesis/export family protein n=1 Tax=uncultured Mailhella sp. TaxID=1981031 RepID=UPI0026126699|nr:SLBB domain-containing protein [uncultured Mailhella sp.]
MLQEGDRILVRMWGSLSMDEVCTISEGSLELPGVGQIPVAGLSRNTAEQIQQAILSKLNVAGITGVQVYARPLDTQGISVFVTGFVSRPGSYAGMPSDTVLFFLDKAGGVDARRGSYRDIKILRRQQVMASADLYAFALQGRIPSFRFQNGDTIVVEEKGPSVSVSGEVRNAARFEFEKGKLTGEALIRLADPNSRATHVSITGFRGGTPYNQYLPLRDFSRLRLENDDQVRFLADAAGDTIMVEAQGAILGASRFPLKRSARLQEVMSYISVDPERANLGGLYLRRKSTAREQKKAIDDALARLEHNAYTATSSSNDEAQIRAKEAEMLSSFIARARQVQPEGIVVVGSGGRIADIALEDGDVIVIPEKTDVVLISGEVLMPQAVVWNADRSMKEYIRSAGGFSNRADTSNIIVVHPDGEVVPRAGAVQPGDHIMVMPRVDSKNMQAVKEISQILYQIAVACKVILDV